MPAAPAVDLVIPARDEEASLPALMAALPWSALRRVVVVDNGSRDRTAALARAAGAAVVREPRRGYGAACLAGLAWLAAAGPPDAVAFIDADLADAPAELPRLWRPILAGEADLVIGSRPRLAEPGSLTRTQRTGNAIACGLTRLLTGRRFTDLGPMRAVRWSSLRRLEMSDRTWGWTLEMQYKAAVLGLRTAEIDVPYRRRHAGRSKIAGSIVGSARAGGKIIYTLGRLWWQARAAPPAWQAEPSDDAPSLHDRDDRAADDGRRVSPGADANRGVPAGRGGA